MRKWWLLLAALLLWTSLGYALFGTRAANGNLGAPRAARPARIVSLAPNLTEILYALGLAPNVVGVTGDSDYPAAAAAKPRVGSFWQPDIEAVIAAQPDLVVTLGFEQQRNLADRLSRMHYDSLVLDIDKVEDLFRSIVMIGRATGADDRAQELVANIRSRIDALQTRLGTGDRTTVLWVVQRDPLRVAGRDTFANELIEMAGGRNAIGATLHKYPPIGSEQVIASAAQVIIEPTMTAGDENRQREQALDYWSRFPNVPAVANGRIYVVDGDLVSRLGPRLYQGVETVAKCLRPESFGE
jgi:iron complex transport system substrate-binding protein